MRPSAFVFSITRIGDLVQATLTFDSLAARYPGGVTLATAPAAAPLVQHDRRLDRVEVVTGVRPLAWRWEVGRLLLRARREGAEVVNLEVWRPRWRFVRRLTRLLGIPARHIDLDGMNDDHRAFARSGDPTCLRHFATFYAEAVGLPDGQVPSPRLEVAHEARAAAEARLSEGSKSPGPRIVVHIGSSTAMPEKRGGAKLYGRVLQRLCEELHARLILVGTRGELPFIDEVLTFAGTDCGAEVMAGSLPLSELPATIEQAPLFIGNDSGPLKVAEAVGVRTVSLWSVTPPEQLGPRGPGHRMLHMTDVEATADAVLRAARELIAEDVA